MSEMSEAQHAMNTAIANGEFDQDESTPYPTKPDWKKIAGGLHWIIKSQTPVNSSIPQEILAEYQAALEDDDG